jgi:hypothetical protein
MEGYVELPSVLSTGKDKGLFPPTTKSLGFQTKEGCDVTLQGSSGNLNRQHDTYDSRSEGTTLHVVQVANGTSDISLLFLYLVKYHFQTLPLQALFCQERAVGL